MEVESGAFADDGGSLRSVPRSADVPGAGFAAAGGDAAGECLQPRIHAQSSPRCGWLLDGKMAAGEEVEADPHAYAEDLQRRAECCIVRIQPNAARPCSMEIADWLVAEGMLLERNGRLSDASWLLLSVDSSLGSCLVGTSTF